MQYISILYLLFLFISSITHKVKANSFSFIDKTRGVLDD